MRMEDPIPQFMDVNQNASQSDIYCISLPHGVAALYGPQWQRLTGHLLVTLLMGLSDNPLFIGWLVHPRKRTSCSDLSGLSLDCQK